jgi:hypothetical protein
MEFDAPDIIGNRRFDLGRIGAGDEMWAAGEWSIIIQGQNGPMPFHGYRGAVKAREGDTWKTRLDVNNTAPRPAATAAARWKRQRRASIASIGIP